MIDWDSDFGRHVQQRLASEEVMWMVTVDGAGVPQPRPIWFEWDGATLLIFSQPGAAKVRHIARSPKVAMHFNTNPAGEDVCVMLGEAHVLEAPPPAARVRAYLDKYAALIPAINFTEESLQAEFSLALLFTPTAMRGWQ